MSVATVHAVLDWPALRSRLSYFKQRVLEADPAFTDAMHRIVAHVRSVALTTESDRFDYVRHWVHLNSVHLVDEAHDRYSSKTHVVLPMLWSRHLGAGEAPHLACGSRAFAMKAILNRLGSSSRVVDVFKVFPSGLVQTHTFLEVWNGSIGSWEVQDPDYDIAYRDLRTGRRASVAQLVADDTGQVEPFNQVGRGWTQLDLPGLRGYFRIAVYRLSYEGERSIAVIHSSRLRPGFTVRSRGEEMGVVDFLKKHAHVASIQDETGREVGK